MKAGGRSQISQCRVFGNVSFDCDTPNSTPLLVPTQVPSLGPGVSRTQPNTTETRTKSSSTARQLDPS